MMQWLRRMLRGGTVAVLILSLLATPMLVAAQDEDPEPADDELPLTCNPLLAHISERLELNCDEVLALMADGYGMGELVKALLLAEHLYEAPLSIEDVQAVLDMRQKDGEVARGWGSIAHAVALSDALAEDGFDYSVEEILALRESEELGWGQLRQAQALASEFDDLDFMGALEMLQAGMGWGEIRDAYGLEPGPPPWAGPPPKVKLNPGQGANGNHGASSQAPGHSGEKGRPAEPPGQAKKNQP